MSAMTNVSEPFEIVAEAVRLASQETGRHCWASEGPMPYDNEDPEMEFYTPIPTDCHIGTEDEGEDHGDFWKAYNRHLSRLLNP